MKKYDLENLKKINSSYDYEHCVTEKDVSEVNKLIDIIENSRNSKKPIIGDIVQYVDKYGDYHENAHIDCIYDKELYICEHSSVPFIFEMDNIYGFSLSTSGGPWSYIPRDSLKFIRNKDKMFKVWGHKGATANGAVEFLANVNVWEYKNSNPLYGKLSTKTHTKFYVTIWPEDRIGADKQYKYTILTSGGNKYKTFKTDEEYKVWLRTFKCIEYPRDNDIVVWGYKPIKKYVSKEDFDNIKEFVSYSLWDNGKKVETKVMYENTNALICIEK